MPEEVIETNSILKTTKKLIGVGPEYTHFDVEMVVHINTTFMILNQMGVGPDIPFRITGDSETWDQFMQEDIFLDGVKTYMFLKCKLVFDPPASSVLVDAINKSISELEWRMANSVTVMKRERPLYVDDTVGEENGIF